MWLYATKEGTETVKSISMVDSRDRMEGDDFVKGLNSSLGDWDNYRGIDINTGAGGKYRYLRYAFSGAKKR